MGLMLRLQMSWQGVPEEPLKSVHIPLARTQIRIGRSVIWMEPLFDASITELGVRHLQFRSRQVPRLRSRQVLRLVRLTMTSVPPEPPVSPAPLYRQTVSRTGSMLYGLVFEIEKLARFPRAWDCIQIVLQAKS